MESHIKASVNLISRIVKGKPDAPLIVNFSGGKDSLCCLLLALSVTDDVECLYMASGLELPGTIDYVDARCKEFGVPLNISDPQIHRIRHRRGGGVPVDCCLLPDYVRHWGYFPTSAKRYCSTWLKHRPGRVLCRQNWGLTSIFKIVGIRLSESNIRRYRYGSTKTCMKFGGRYIRPDREHSGSYMVFPILDWTQQHVEQFLADHQVEIHEGYKHFGTSGCAWCPVMKPATAQLIAAKFPGIYDELVAAEAAIKKPAWYHRNVWLKDIVEAATKI